MNRPQLLLIVAALASSIACKDARSVEEDAITGSVRVDLGGDATREGGNLGVVPSDVDEIWIRVDEVAVHHDGEGWVLLEEGRQDVNLMANRDGATERVGDGQVYVGDCDRFRLTLEDSWIVVDGVEHDLDLTRGLDFDRTMELSAAVAVNESTQATIWLGWDLDTNLSEEEGNWYLDDDVSVTVDVESL